MSIDDASLCQDVVISREAVGVSDGVQRQLIIEAEGVPQEVTESIYLCTESKFIGFSPPFCTIFVKTILNISDILPECSVINECTVCRLISGPFRGLFSQF